MLMQSAAGAAGSFFANLFNRITSAFSRWRETGRLDAREIEVVARDLNISPTEPVSLMFIAPAPLELRDLRRARSRFSETARCGDIRHKRMASPSKYCPNALTLRSLDREACQLRSAQVLAFPMKLS
jgi:hypothetical protein